MYLQGLLAALPGRLARFLDISPQRRGKPTEDIRFLCGEIGCFEGVFFKIVELERGKRTVPEKLPREVV